MKTKKRSLLYIIAILFFLSSVPVTKIQAACPLPSGGNVNIGANTCTVSTITGADNAIITLDNAASSITINNGGKLCAGSLKTTAGSTSIQTGGTIKTSCTLYITDADSDGYVPNLTMYDTTGAGRRRVSLMTSLTNLDCNDSNAATFATLTCYPNADGDAYYSTTSHSVCSGVTCAAVGESATVGNDCNDSNAATYTTIQCYPNADGDGYYSKNLGTAFCGSTCAAAGQSATVGTDCNDANAATYATIQCYADGDVDGYYTKTLGTAFCGSTCAAAGQSATVGNDCCDTDNRAHPGASAYTTADACGSFDYNCDGVATLGDTAQWGGCGTCGADSGQQKCVATGGGNGGFDGIPGCGQVGTYRFGGGCDEMATYPSNCRTATCAYNNPTQACY